MGVAGWMLEIDFGRCTMTEGDAPVPLDISSAHGLGKAPGWAPPQLRTVSQLSGRVGRFSEEVGGFDIAPNPQSGSMGAARDGVVGLTDNTLAVLTARNLELQLIDMGDSSVRVVPLGALENNLCSSPPMARYTPPPAVAAAMRASKASAAKTEGPQVGPGDGDQVLIFSARHSALLVVDSSDEDSDD